MNKPDVPQIPKFLFHYTSIETLDKIVTNKSIRFNRLDKVNDKNEGKSLDLGNLGIYVFVSCWTDNERENISLWHIYSNQLSGVRIKLPTKMFRFYELESQPERALHIAPNTLYPKRIEEIHGSDYLLAPVPIDFPSKIIYTDDWKNIIPKVASDYSANMIHLGKIGMYKRNEWSHEEEWRFKLRIMPAPPPPKKTYLEYKDNFNILVEKQFMRREVSIESIFLDLTEDALQQMEIMIGPLSDGTSIAQVADILSKNNLSVKVIKSSLTNQIAR